MSRWVSSTLRVCDPEASLAFYCNILGLTLVHRIDIDSEERKCSFLYLQSLPNVLRGEDDEATGAGYSLKPGSKHANMFVLSTAKPMLRLEWIHGTESNADFAGYHAGNQEGDGFGHIAVACDDVYASCDKLQKADVNFRKLPDEGRMKGLAFALDPDGYWVEVVRRTSPRTTVQLPEFSLAQTMLRIKDPKASVEFYTSQLDMVLVSTRHFSSFSLYFLSSPVPTLGDVSKLPDTESEEAREVARERLYPWGYSVLELTHNHGTEDQAAFQYDNGNTAGRQGFANLGFAVDNLEKRCSVMKASGTKFHKDLGTDTETTVAVDPDGYLIEIAEHP